MNVRPGQQLYVSSLFCVASPTAMFNFLKVVVIFLVKSLFFCYQHSDFGVENLKKSFWWSVLSALERCLNPSLGAYQSDRKLILSRSARHHTCIEWKRFLVSRKYTLYKVGAIPDP